MKRINRMIRHTIIEIIVVIALVFLSIPVWKSFDLEKYASVAMYYDNMGANYLEVSDFSDYVLYQVNDMDAIESIKPINLRLSNTSNSLEDYAIWMNVSKSSTLDNESIKLRIDNEISYLTDFEMFEDEEYYYYLIFEGKLSQDIIQKNVQIYIDINYQEDVSNTYLSFDFVNIPRQIL